MPADLPLADELSAVFARMSGVLLSEETVSTALRLVTSLASETIPGTVGAGITLVDEQGRKTTAGASDPLVERADSLQYELNQGPCLTAWAGRALVRVDDIPADTRWPDWSAAVEPLALRAALSAPLVAGDVALGAIKVYADRPHAYGTPAERVLTKFAAQGAILLANVQSYERAQRLSDDLRGALRSRDVIGMAKGVLMARDGVDEEVAFVLLADAAQREHKKLRDVAQALVTSAGLRRH
jgi:GAF domain-containing protein